MDPTTPRLWRVLAKPHWVKFKEDNPEIFSLLKGKKEVEASEYEISDMEFRVPGLLFEQVEPELG